MHCVLTDPAVQQQQAQQQVQVTCQCLRDLDVSSCSKEYSGLWAVPDGC